MKRIIAAACVLYTCACSSIVQATGLDTAFGNQGRVVVGAGQAVRSILQADGKLVVVGTTIPYAPTFFPVVAQLPKADFLIARYNTDGTPDKTFAGSGLLRLDFNGGADFAAAVTQQPDGKLVVAGSAVSAAGEIAPAAVRLNTDGTLDTTFNVTGKVIYDSIPATYVSGTTQLTVPHGHFTFNEVFVLPAGKLLFSASYYDDSPPPGSHLTTGEYLSVRVRALSDGQLDASYGSTAAGWAGDSSDYWVQQPEGGFLGTRFVGLGTPSPDGLDSELVRYDAEGVRDSTFGSNGAVLLRHTPGTVLIAASAVAIRPNGAVLIAGGESSLDLNPPGTLTFTDFVTQVDSQADIDTAFGTSGRVRGYQGDFSTATAGAVLEPGGKALLAGFAATTASLTSPADVSIVRLGERGTLDPTFGPSGRVMLDLSEGSTTYSSYAIDLLRRRDGHLLVVANRGKPTGRDSNWGQFADGTEQIVIEQLVSTPQFASSATAATVAASETSAVLTVTRTGNPDGPVSVDYVTTGSTITHGTLTWQPGDADSKTLTVAVDASQRQAEKQFTLVLDNPSEGTVTSGPTVVTVAATASSGGKSGGGGGAIDVFLLTLLMFGCVWRVRRPLRA